MLFAERLRWLRERKGFSQKEIADKIGISQQGYSHLETGRREPNLETLIKLSRVFDESIDFIVGNHIEDVRASHLYELYEEARKVREEIQEDIQYYEEQINKPGSNAESYLSTIKKERDELRTIQNKEDRFLNMFMEHIFQIPGDNDECRTKEFWIEHYTFVKEKYEKSYNEFREDFNKYD